MRLAHCTPTMKRRLLTCCAGDPTGPMTAAQKAQLLRQLLSPTWAPTPQDTPVAFAAVEAWYGEQQRRTLPAGGAYGHL